MSVFNKSRPKWWSSLLLVIVLVVSLIQPAMAAGPSTPQDAVALLRQYNLIRGDNNGDLQLGSPITRAQLAVILVRATGREADVQNFTGLRLFTDTTGHWAEGYIASARVSGLMKGFEDGSFHPDEAVTYAQAFTMILRLVGREPNAQTWPTSAVLEAMDLKMVPPGFTGVGMVNMPAVRGEIFTSLAYALTHATTAQGQTYLQKLVDSTAPEVSVTVPASTMDSSINLTGSAKGATQVSVNGAAATLAGESFSYTASLQFGVNRFTVRAEDAAGNFTTKDVAITRTSPAARLSVVGPNRVGIGSTASFVIKAYDTAGAEVSTAGVSARVSGAIGTFDAATGTLTAAQAPATGKIEVSLGQTTASADVTVSGLSASAAGLSIDATNVPYTRDMVVRVSVVDIDGNLVNDDFGRVVGLNASGTNGVTVSPNQTTTQGGVAQFTVRATDSGAINLSAISVGLPSAGTVAKFTTAIHVVLVPDTSRISTGIGQTAKIKAELRDDRNNLVANKTGNDISIDLDITGPGSLLQSTVRIARDATNSTQTSNDGLVAPGTESGTVTITGTIRSGQDYTVDSASVGVYNPAVGSGTHFNVIPLTSRVTVGTNQHATFLVQLVDSKGNPISSSDYAFQVEVSTSNGEPEVDGIPDGVKVRLGDTGLNPVSNGKSDGSDVIARTSLGSATIEVEYDKPGTVTLKPVVASATSEAYDSEGNADKALSSSSSWIQSDSSADATFETDPNSIKVTVDSDTYGKEAPAAAVKSGTARTMTLHAYVAWYDKNANDQTRYWVPDTIRSLALYKNGKQISKGEARNGKVDFTVTSPSSATAGADEYIVKDLAAQNALQDSNSLLIWADDHAPGAAGAPIIRGTPSNSAYQVQADDTGMEIDLPLDSSLTYVIARVYADGSSTAIYTSDPIDVSGGNPQIVVPKKSIPSGVKNYYVKYRNGYGESSEKGALSYPVTNFTTATNIGITGAKYDAPEQILHIYGSGFSKDDSIDGTKLYITDSSIADPKPNDDVYPNKAYLSGAQTVSISTSEIQLDLSTVIKDEQDKLATFAGYNTVKLSAEVGWDVKATGQTAGEDLNTAVSPMALIDYAAYEPASHRLRIFGRGFKSGTLVKSAVTVGTHKLDESGMTVSVFSDTEIWVTLNQAAYTELEGTAGVTVNAADGWMTDGARTVVGEMAQVSGVEVYGYLGLTRVSYSNGKVTITGSGFTGGTVVTDLQPLVNLVYKDKNGDHTVGLENGAVSDDGRFVTFDIVSKAAGDAGDVFKTVTGVQVYLVADPGWFQVKLSDKVTLGSVGSDRVLKFSK